MSKKLITKDYTSFVFEAFKLPQEDFYHYYLDIVETNLKYNPDIVEKLVKAVDLWIDWYNSQIYGQIIEREMPDGSIEFIDSKQTFSINENGEVVKNDLKKVNIPLLPEFGINRHVNRSFFDEQLRKLEIIQESINLKNNLISLYTSIPVIYRDQFGENFIPTGLHIEDLREANAALQEISTPDLKDKNIIVTENLIVFQSLETKEKVFMELKGFFPGYEEELQKALNGEKLNKKILFPANQNKFVEAFRRLNYNNKIISNYTEIRDWICQNFQFHYKQGKRVEVRDFKPDTVYDGLKGKGNPPKGKRILESDWIPFQTLDKLREESNKEK